MNIFKKNSFLILSLVASFTSCTIDTQQAVDRNNSTPKNWKEYIETNIGLLGHRNWIVVTDMAYPLQSKTGIVTIDTGEDYESVLEFVDNLIDKQPHVRANIYQDLELQSLTNAQVAGIENVKEITQKFFSEDITYYIEHEKLITKLDEVSQTFNVIILKSNLTMPFASTFFELDCKYWK